MAKRKQAAALFEVIHHDKRFTNRHANWSWPKFRWWPKRAERVVDDTPRGPSLIARLFALVPPVPRIGLESDPELQEVRFRLSYTAAVVSAFSLVVVVTLAYMIGRHGGHAPIPALAEKSTEELRAGPTQPEVLDVQSGNDGAGAMAMASTNVPANPPPAPAEAKPASAKQPNPQSNLQGVRPSHWSAPRGPSTLLVTDAKRQVGLNYVLIQSYPPEEEKYAKAVVDLLNQNGILCTMERNVPYAPRWICIIGVDGFSRTKDSPDYDRYIAKARQIEAQAAGTSKFLKRFELKPYPWKDRAKAE
jgi:hypothetical protein